MVINIEKYSKKLSNLARKRVKTKSLRSMNNATLELKEKTSENIWEDPNRFFKSEFSEAKKSMFWEGR